MAKGHRPVLVSFNSNTDLFRVIRGHRKLKRTEFFVHRDFRATTQVKRKLIFGLRKKISKIKWDKEIRAIRLYLFYFDIHFIFIYDKARKILTVRRRGTPLEKREWTG